MSTDDSPEVSMPASHIGVAEQGKCYALQGKHDWALAYYREAIRMTVQAGEHEIVFRHYLECVLESLELTGAYDEVLDYCDKALALLAGSESTPHTEMELAHILQRQGVAHLKAGQREEASAALRRAVEKAKALGWSLPLAATLLGWVERGLQVDSRRIVAEQQRNRYFIVRPETVDAARAVKLPNESLILGLASR
ncbi:tetratricopeptide repeat protein [Methyloterricola oryzae]|uniref:tetratricopeptide repeat protein n=1 Tax=Methyloterricola oryzae TaxID=1495050 RepID=UPI001F384D2C|nr:tetratricopeptide repeat protein [Methyloterricola oryzae]